MSTTTFTHHGAWNESSRKVRSLRFLEQYMSGVDSSDRASRPSSDFWSSLGVYHDTKGEAHVTGPHIWEVCNIFFTAFRVYLLETASGNGED